MKFTDNKNTMDTIIIKVHGPKRFTISDRSLFLPEIKTRAYADLTPTERSSRHHYLQKFILHPKKQEDYIPRVELFETLTENRDDIRYTIKIEFSAPKLLYSNSLQEVGEHDMEKVIYGLKTALERVGIGITTENLLNAVVSGVHVCKNIPLPKTVRMREIINQLAKMNISKAFDVSDRQHKKGGRVLNFHSGTIEWSIYDKISDCLRPKNKRIDKSRVDHEKTVIELYQLQGREVFRYEYRIKKGVTVKREVNELLGRKFETIVTFKDLFTPHLVKKLTLNSWHAIIDLPENQLSLFETNTLELFLHILSEANKTGISAHSMNNAFISYGLAIAIREHGAKEVRGAIFDVWNTNHPERLSKKIKVAAELTSGLPLSNNITFINAAFEKFEIISLISLQNGI